MDYWEVCIPVIFLCATHIVCVHVRKSHNQQDLFRWQSLKENKAMREPEPAVRMITKLLSK